MKHPRTRLTTRSLLVCLLVAIALLALSQVALAAAAPTFTLKQVDKGGTTQTLGTWTYDAAQQSFYNGATEASFVQTFSPYLRYSGRDSGFIRLAVVKKGITVAGLVEYAEAQTDIPLGDATAMGTHATDDFTSSRTVGSMSGRYYYPSYLIDGTWNDATRSLVAPVLGITSYGIRNNQTTDRGWGIPALVTLNGGSTYPNPTDNATLDGGFALLAAAADDVNSLKLFQGQSPSTPEANLGSMSASLVDTVTFTPVYETITPHVTGGGSATVTTDDGYLKATATEPVSFSVDDVTSGYHVATVGVTDASSNPVTVNEVAGTYSFTMPATDATVTVTLAADPVVLQVKYDGTLQKSYKLVDLKALTPWVGYAGLWRGSYANGPDAVTGVTVGDVVRDALGAPLTASQNVQVFAADTFTKTFSYDRLTTFTGFALYDATSGQIVPVSSLTGPLAAVLVYDDPAGNVMSAAAGPLRFFIGDAAPANADNMVMAPANESVQRVAVLDVQPIRVTGVSVDPTSMTLGVGDAGQVTATVLPADAADKEVTWSSSNEAIATVDADGLITAHAGGAVIIEAKTHDGEFTSDCAVTVVGIQATQPASGARWRTGTTQLVRFAVQGPFSGGEFGILLTQGGDTTVAGTLATTPGQAEYSYRWAVAGDPGAAELQVAWRPAAGSGVWTIMSTSTPLTILKELQITVTSPGADALWARGSVQKVKWSLQDSYRNGRFTLILRDANGRTKATRTADVKRGSTTYSAGLRLGKSLKRGTYTVTVRWSNGRDASSGASPAFRVK